MRTYKSIGYKKRHYEDFARILGAYDAPTSVITAVMRLFAEDNSNFNSERFLARIAEYQVGARDINGELVKRVK